MSDKGGKMSVYYAEAVYGEEEIEAVVKVLRERPHALMTGEAVREFEEKIAAKFGKQTGVMVNSGSSANLLTVATLDLPPGSEVITPVLTFSTTVAPLVQNGLVPAFVDVEEATYNIDATKVEAMIGDKTRALFIPNLMGNLPKWDELRALADKYDLVVVEDSCDTLGAQYKGGPSGRFSDVSTTSFYASHVITAAGFGGMVSVNDEGLANRARLLRGWGRSSSVTGESEDIEDRFHTKVGEFSYDAKFLFNGIGYNFLPSELSAAFGLVQLGRLDDYIGRRKRNFRRLLEYFSAHQEWFLLPRQHEGVDTAWLAFPLIVRPEAPFRRNDLQIFLEENNIQTRTVFTGNILRQPGFKDILCRTDAAGYPNADRVMQSGMLLGCHQGLTGEQMDYMLDRLDHFLSRQRSAGA